MFLELVLNTSTYIKVFREIDLSNRNIAKFMYVRPWSIRPFLEAKKPQLQNLCRSGRQAPCCHRFARSFVPAAVAATAWYLPQRSYSWMHSVISVIDHITLLKYNITLPTTFGQLGGVWGWYDVTVYWNHAMSIYFSYYLGSSGSGRLCYSLGVSKKW